MPRRQTLDVISLLRDVASTAQLSTRRAPASIPIFGDEATVTADPDMLRAALLNVLLNACQAAGEKEVTVQVAKGDGVCRIAVCDRGAGIPAPVRERVFEPFFTTRTNGTGLGLAIVKRLVELHDGEVTLLARPGGGTIVEIALPDVVVQDTHSLAS